MKSIFYLHINSVNLGHYFSSACIKATKYFVDRSHDLQSQCPDFLVLSTLPRIKNSDCTLEIVLTESEKQELINVPSNSQALLFAKPLPISRVKSIYFETKEQKDKIVTLVNLSTAFVPKYLAKLYESDIAMDFSNIEFPKNDAISDYSAQLQIFNSILGGFALMKISREPYMNYSDNYFSTLALFNSRVEEDLTKNKKLNTIYHDAFFGKENFKSITPLLNKNISEEDLNSIAILENQIIRKNNITGIIELESLEKATYLIAVLFSYGLSDEGRKNKIDGLIINNFAKHIKADRSEVIALCFGLNRGYTAFSNKYRGENGEQIVKFELDSLLDYYTIESIYQYSINGIIKSGAFPYLESWCANKTGSKAIRSKSDYYILDELVIGERINVGDIKWWSRLMSIFFQKQQEELFKPFMLAVFNRMKNDIQEEFTFDLENKQTEILRLTHECESLNSKIRELEKKSVKSTKQLPKSTENQKSDDKVNEPTVPYANGTVHQAQPLEYYKQQVDEYKKLLLELIKQKKMADAKKLIVDFNIQNSNPDLFKDTK